MKKIAAVITGFFITAICFAQTNFITSGKIEFERKTNSHRLYFTESEMGAFDEQFKKLVPQFQTDYFELIFTDNKSLYKPGRGADDPKNSILFPAPGAANVVYKDFNSELAASQKQVFETLFLVNDSIAKPIWKLETDTRTIAGFECRKAVTRICDSVVIVAFYTEEIVSSSGPESFSGLPGMILGLAVPRLYTTWFATKIELLDDKESKKIVAPIKGKKATDKDLFTQIDKVIKNWGDKFRDRSLWFTSL